MATKMIRIVHKDTKLEALVPKRSLKSVWAERGWKLAPKKAS